MKMLDPSLIREILDENRREVEDERRLNVKARMKTGWGRVWPSKWGFRFESCLVLSSVISWVTADLKNRRGQNKETRVSSQEERWRCKIDRPSSDKILVIRSRSKCKAHHYSHTEIITREKNKLEKKIDGTKTERI